MNHLSAILGVDAIEEIAAVGESKNISFKDLVQTLVKIKANLIANSWTVLPVKRTVRKLCSKLGIEITSLDPLGLPPDGIPNL